MNKIKTFIRKKIVYLIVLLIITIISGFYISQKEGYHMDELLSFELSNAEFTPWIVPTQPEGRLEKFVKNEIDGDTFAETVSHIFQTLEDVWENRSDSKLLTYQADVSDAPVWISANQFHQYLTVDGSDSFNYISVYFNVKDDNHPPLHFMLLHTISSIFQNQIHPWMGCIINLIATLGICIILMKICSTYLKRPYLGIAVSILYTCSMAGLATLLLIRMYALLTFWCMAAMYMHIKKLREVGWKKQNKLFILIVVCGFLTQYFFVFFMIFTALITTILLAARKEKKEVLYYLRTLVIAAIWGLCLFPFSIQDVLSSGRGEEAVANLTSGLSGLSERIESFVLILWQELSGKWIGAGIFCIGILVATIVMILQKYPLRQKMCECWKMQEKREMILLFLVPTIGYFIMVSRAAPYYADRYMMPVFPIIALEMGVFIQILLEKIFKKENIRIGLLAIIIATLVIPSMLTETPEYLYKGYKGQIEISEQYAQDDCICVYDGVGYYQNLIEFTNYKNTLLVTQEELLEREKDQELEEDQELVVLFKNGISQDAVSEYLSSQYGYQMTKVLLQEGVHQDTICLYQK